MSAFSGPQHRGALRAHRALKRDEATVRGAAVRPERTKAARRGPVKLGGSR